MSPCASIQRFRDPTGKLQFTTVDFGGQLTVTDGRAFATALVGGIGHAKAFGCGLLLVRPVG